MAIGDTPNQNLFGTNYNPEDEEEKRARLAAQDVRMGAGSPTVVGVGNIPASAFGQAPAVAPFSMEAAGQVNPMMQPQNLESFAQPQVTFRDYDVPATPPASALSVFTPGGEVKPNVDVNAITPSPKTLPDPSEINTALNQEVPFESQISSGPDFSGVGVSLSPFTQGLLDSAYRGVSQPQFGIMGIDPSQNPYGDFATTRPDGTKFYQDEVKQPAVIPMVSDVEESTGSAAQGQGMDLNQSAIMNALTDQNQGMDMNQQAIANAQGQEATVPPPAQTLSQFMRYEDSPGQRTEQFVDEQGRMRFRPTQEALQLQGQGSVAQPPVNGAVPPVTAQPPAAALSSFEQDSLSRQQRIGGTGSYEGDSEARDARVRANDRQSGETQTERDTRVAQSRTTGGQTQGLSFDDAKRRAKAQLAARGIDDANSSMVNNLARGIQAGEPERLAELETERAINEARLKTAEAELNRPEFKGRVYTVNGVTFAQTSRGGVQVISTGTENPEEATAKMKDFVFTKKKIEEAREAYKAGDVTKANDILTAANIQQYGAEANATEYFKDSDTSGTGGGLTQQQQEVNITRQAFDTMEEAEAANLGKGTKITIGGRNATV